MISFASPCLEEGKPCCFLRTEEDIHIGKDLLDTFSCLIASPQISAEVYVKGDERAGVFEVGGSFLLRCCGTVRSVARVIPLVWKQRVEVKRDSSKSSTDMVLIVEWRLS